MVFLWIIAHDVRNNLLEIQKVIYTKGTVLFVYFFLVVCRFFLKFAPSFEKLCQENQEKRVVQVYTT